MKADKNRKELEKHPVVYHKSHPLLSKSNIAGAALLGPLHMSPVNRAGPLTGANFILGSYEKFQPGFQDSKRSKTSCGAKFAKKATWRNTKLY